MAIPVAIAGALKTALKKSLKEVAKTAVIEASKGKTSAEIATTLGKLAESQITDVQAVLLNRLKTAPNKIIYDYLSKDMGLPISEVRKIVNGFKQTSKMAEASKSKVFRDLINKNVTNKLGLNKIKSIKDFLGQLGQETKQNQTPEQPLYDNQPSIVEKYLLQIQNEVDKKIHGIRYTDKTKHDLDYDLSVFKYYNESYVYTDKNIELLINILDKLSQDIENYNIDDGANDVVVIETINAKGKRYNIFDKNIIDNFVKELFIDLKYALKEFD